MIDLTQYGFEKIKQDVKYAEYKGHGFIITVYDYPYMTAGGAEVHKQSFVFRTKRYTSMAYEMSELENWLAKQNIKKG